MISQPPRSGGSGFNGDFSNTNNPLSAKRATSSGEASSRAEKSTGCSTVVYGGSAKIRSKGGLD